MYGIVTCLVLLLTSSSSLAHACNKDSSDWPDCLPNRLNGTYFIQAQENQNDSCPGEPCLTLSEFIEAHFVYNNVSDRYEAALSDNSSLLFLPGSHHLNLSLYFYTSSAHSLTIAGLNNNCNLEEMRVIINCETDVNIRLEDFGEVSLGCLNLYSCFLVCQSSRLLSANQISLHGTLLRANSTKANFTNIMVGPHAERKHNGELRIRYTEGATISNVVFAHNNQPDMSENGVLHVHDSSDVTITNCSFYNNANPIESRGVIHLHSSHNISLSECKVYDNRKNGIFAIDSTFRLSGNLSFVNNTAYEGGAISLFNSFVEISSNANLLFEGNHAEHVGGGIFSSSSTNRPFSIAGSCALSIDSEVDGSFPKINFINNTADNGGSAMYGIVLSELLCLNSRDLNPIEIVPKIMTISPDDTYAVSSDPVRVCLCPDHSTPDCLAILPEDHPQLQYTVYPGQKFNISASVVGPNFALTHGSLYSRFFNSTSNQSSLSSSVREVFGGGCSDLEFSIRSRSKSETLILSADGRAFITNSQIIQSRIDAQNENDLVNYYGSEGISNNPSRYYSNGTFRTDRVDSTFELAGNVVHALQTVPVFISITLLDCPPGFVHSDDPAQCLCDPVLLDKNVTCNIDDQTVRRYGSTWVNASFTGNDSGVIVQRYCPFDYCRPEGVNVDLTQPDTQCAFNHSGTLCGACKPGLSLALGSSQCLECSNRYISLVIVFVIAGFALVFFIKVLNLTVAEGTINGLIFYANIVKASESLLFPAVRTRFVLSVFISWLNLDFGFESCFFDGMDGYWKSWLQFLFPFYVWIITASIIVASHYSTRATKIFGKRSVPILATLILLSYAKLLRTIIDIFSFSFINFPNGTRSVVWAFDGNVPLLGVRHGFLFLFALAVVLLLFLPYTVILLSAGWLRKHVHRRGLHRLVPFFDANFGPLKDKRYYWIGVLLLVRGVLFVFFASFLNFESNINVLLIAVTSICLIYVSLIGRFYKKLYLTILENSFFLNLGVLAAGTLYINVAGGSQYALVYLSVGIACIQFCGILIFHCYCFILLEARKKWIEYKRNKKLKSRLMSTNNDSSSDLVVVYSTPVQVVTTDNESPSFNDNQNPRFFAADNEDVPLQMMINFTELREPLLEST